MKNRTILIVEDNRSDIELTQRALKKNHISNELVIAEDGIECLDYLFSRGKYENNYLDSMPSLILLDLNLPKLSGLEVLKEIRNNPKTKYIPVVVLTSSKEESDIFSSYDYGANSYIRKPVDFFNFSEAIKQLGLYWLVINEPPPLV